MAEHKVDILATGSNEKEGEKSPFITSQSKTSLSDLLKELKTRPNPDGVSKPKTPFEIPSEGANLDPSKGLLDAIKELKKRPDFSGTIKPDISHRLSKTSTTKEEPFITLKDVYEFTDPFRQIPNIAYGMASAIEETANFINRTSGVEKALEAVGLPGQSHFIRESIPESKYIKDDLIRSGAQFLLPFGATVKGLTIASKLLRGIEDLSKLWQYGIVTVAGGLPGYVAINPNDPNVANIISQYPTLIKPISDYLSTNPNDPESLNRLRNSIIDIGFGVAADGIIHGLLRLGLRFVVKPIKETLSPTLTEEEQRLVIESWKRIQKDTPSKEHLTHPERMWIKTENVIQATVDEMRGGKHIDIVTKDQLGEKNVWAVFRDMYFIGNVVDEAIREGGSGVSRFARFSIRKDNKLWSVTDETGTSIGKTYKTKPEALDALREYELTAARVPAGTRSLNDIINPVIRAGKGDTLEGYFLAIRMKYLKKAKAYKVINKETGIESTVEFKVPWTDEHIEANIKNGENTRIDYHGQFKSIAEIAEDYKTFNRHIVDEFGRKGEIISEDTANDFIEAGLYTSLERVFPEETVKIPGRSIRRGGSRGAMGKRLTKTGSEDYIIQSPLVTMYENVSSIIETSMKNRIFLYLDHVISQLRKVNPELADAFMKDAPHIPTTIKVDIKDIIKKLNNKGIGITDPSLVPEEAITFFNRKLLPLGNNIQIGFKEGKPFAREIVDPYLAKTVGALGPRPAIDFPSALFRLGNIAKTVLTNTVTMFPDFLLRNPVRDMASAYLLTQSKKGFIPGWDTARGIAAQFNKDPDYILYKLNGGMGGNLIHGEAQTYVKKLQKYYKTRGFNPNQVQTFGGFTEAWGKMAGALETANRLSEFKQLIKEGMNPVLAGFHSREIGVDFMLRGASQNLRIATGTIPFLNAGLQGIYRFGRATTSGDRKRLATRFILGMIIPTLALQSININNERYKALPNWVKNTNWIIDVQQIQDMVQFLSPELRKSLWEDTQYPGFILFPKPFEFGGILSFVERGIESYIESDPTKAMSSLLEIFGELFRVGTIPQALLPIWDTFITNESFTGSPIEPKSISEFVPEWRVRPYTSSTMKYGGQHGVSQATGISPIQLEYLFKGYTGTLGAFVLETVDDLVNIGIGHGENVELKFEDIPGFGVFYKNDPLKYTQDQVDFYKIYNEVTKRNNSMSFVRSRDAKMFEDLDLIEAYLSKPENIKISAGFSIFKSTVGIASYYNDAIQLVIVDPKLSGVQKRAKIDKYKVELNKLFKTAMLTIKHDPKLQGLLEFKYARIYRHMYRRHEGKPDVLKKPIFNKPSQSFLDDIQKIKERSNGNFK